MNHFEEILKRSIEIHLKKRADYTSGTNHFENFERSNEVAEWFPPEYKSFAVLIGTKLARLASLLTKKTEPNNESIDDSFLDLVTYAGLMYSFYCKLNEPHNPEAIKEINRVLNEFEDNFKNPYSAIESCKHRTLNSQMQCTVCKEYLTPAFVAIKYRHGLGHSFFRID